MFWNQFVSGFPRILAHQCSNRHGFFLIIEEYEGRRRKGSVLVPKGKLGEGWKRFGEELRLAFNKLHAGCTSYSMHLHVKQVSQPKPKSKLRMSFAEVLRASLPKIEEPVVPPNCTLALAGIKLTYFVSENDIQASAKSSAKGRRDQAFSTAKLSTAYPTMTKIDKMVKAFLAKNIPPKTASASLCASLGRELVSGLWGRADGSSSPMLPFALCKSHFGDSLDLRSIRKTLEKLHVEIGYCLKGLHLLEDDLLGSGPKLPGPSSLPRSQTDYLSFKLPWPKSIKPSYPLSARGPLEPAQLSKGKAPLCFPIKRPKLMVKAKAGSVLHPIPTPHFSLDSGASTFAV